MKTPLLIIFLFASVCKAETGWSITDGNSLVQGIKTFRRAEAKENLTNAEIIEASMTAGYLRGFLDCSNRWSEVHEFSLFKLPEHSIPLPQFVQVVEKFLNDTPQVLHLPSDGLIIMALVKSFPNPAVNKK